MVIRDGDGVRTMHWIKKAATFYTTHKHMGVSLDLSYITDNIVVCSCPTVKWAGSIYANSLSDLVHYLDANHGRAHWRLWNLHQELNNEYDVNDPELRGRAVYVPWPDHQPPPFSQLLSILDSIGNHLASDSGNVAVIHCRWGKGRSGLVAVGVLMTKLGYTMDTADALFTDKRMRTGFGSGVSIKSQRRYANYLSGIHKFHYRDDLEVKLYSIRVVGALFGADDPQIEVEISPLTVGQPPYIVDPSMLEASGENVIINLGSFTLPGVDFKISFQSRFSPRLMGLSTSMASMCFNVYWEGISLTEGNMFPLDTPSVTLCSWDEMDGFKGSAKKGLRLFQGIELFWVATTNHN